MKTKYYILLISIRPKISLFFKLVVFSSRLNEKKKKKQNSIIQFVVEDGKEKQKVKQQTEF